MKIFGFRQFVGCLGSALFLFSGGCARSEDEESGIARTPQEAASQLDQAFASADAATREAANAASEAMRKGEFEQAVVSLQTIRSGPPGTLEQGLAIHSSTVNLEGQLVRAMQAGDKNAERAYELLKAMKRD